MPRALPAGFTQGSRRDASLQCGLVTMARQPESEQFPAPIGQVSRHSGYQLKGEIAYDNAKDFTGLSWRLPPDEPSPAPLTIRPGANATRAG